MRRRQASPVGGRAILGVIALYALLLQAFLGFATPSPVLGGPGAVLCAEHDGSPSDDRAGLDCHPCCTLVHVGTPAPPPPTAATASWPAPGFTRLAWRPEAAVPATGPPARAGSARGPPAA